LYILGCRVDVSTKIKLQSDRRRTLRVGGIDRINAGDSGELSLQGVATEAAIVSGLAPEDWHLR
jgi:hypothetical protein